MTDFFDGENCSWKFNQITEFGKILDPIAEKRTQGVLVISFSFSVSCHGSAFSGFFGERVYHGNDRCVDDEKRISHGGAQMHGEICTAVLDTVTFVILIFPDITYLFVNILVGISILVMAVSFGKNISICIGKFGRRDFRRRTGKKKMHEGEERADCV